MMQTEVGDTEPRPAVMDDDEISLFALATTLLAGRGTIARFMLAGAVIAVLYALTIGKVYKASSTLLLASGESGELSQLRGLASQFGFGGAGGGGSSQLTSALVVNVVKAPVFLRDIAADSLDVPELGGKRAVLDIVLGDTTGKGREPDPEKRLRKGIKALQGAMAASADRRTDAISLSVTHKLPSVAYGLAQAVIARLDDYLFELGKTRASSERRTIEARLATQDRRLRDAEARLAAFLQRNRQYANSPELQFEYDRLQRDVSLQQQVLVSLAQAREQTVSREVQAAPTLTVLEAPLLPVTPEPRGRVKLLAVALMASAIVGVLAVFALRGMRSLVESGDPDARAFVEQVRRIHLPRKRRGTD